MLFAVKKGEKAGCISAGFGLCINAGFRFPTGHSF